MIYVTRNSILILLVKDGECFWTCFESLFQKTPLGEKVLRHLADKYEDRKINMMYMRDFIYLKLHPLDNEENEVLYVLHGCRFQ